MQLFFFEKAHEEQSKVTSHGALTGHNRKEHVLRKACVAKIIHHLMRGRHVPISTTAESEFQQRRCESTDCGASQNGAPSQPPRLLRPASSRLEVQTWPWPLPKETKTFLSPPISLARTTKRARLRGPESSGYVLTFKRLAVAKTAPSTPAALECGEPSQCRGDTSVVSTARVRCDQSKSRSIAFATTLPPASRQILALALSTALNCEAPPHQNPRSGTCSAVVAKGVEGTATPTLTCTEREGQAQATKQENPKQVGIDAIQEVGRRGGQRHPSQKAALRT